MHWNQIQSISRPKIWKDVSTKFNNNMQFRILIFLRSVSPKGIRRKNTKGKQWRTNSFQIVGGWLSCGCGVLINQSIPGFAKTLVVVRVHIAILRIWCGHVDPMFSVWLAYQITSLNHVNIPGASNVFRAFHSQSYTTLALLLFFSQKKTCWRSRRPSSFIGKLFTLHLGQVQKVFPKS